jgi:Protein of unknown function (DUF4012)
MLTIKFFKAIWLLLIPLAWVSLVISLALNRYEYAVTTFNNFRQNNHLELSFPATFDQAQAKLKQAEQTINSFEVALDKLQIEKTLLPLLSPFSVEAETARYLFQVAPLLIDTARLSTNLAEKLLNTVEKKSEVSFGLNRADYQTMRQEVNTIKANLEIIFNLLNQIPFEKLSGASLLKTPLNNLFGYLTIWLNIVERGQAYLEAGEELLGYSEEANFLLLFQDSTEPRPNGGFTGNYALLTLQEGKLTNFRFEDSYVLDDNYTNKGGYIAVPDIYTGWWFSNFSWGLRDVSLTPDFPETARAALNIAKQAGLSEPLKGVIAITPALVQKFLQKTGTIYIPEYQEEITAENLIAKLHYYHLRPGFGEGDNFYRRKDFTRLLATNIFEKVKSLDKFTLLEIILNAVAQKDLQIYCLNPICQKALDEMNWSGRVQQTKPEQDYLMLVETAMSGNKVYSYLEISARDKIKLTPDGKTSHHLTLTYHYKNTPPNHEKGENNGIFISYNRLYLPAQSTVSEREKFRQLHSPVEQYSKKVLGQFVTVVPQENYQPYFIWQSPSGWRPINQKKAVYELLVQKQAGTNLRYSLELENVEGWQIADVTLNAKPIQWQSNGTGKTLIFEGVLETDLAFKISFSAV